MYELNIKDQTGQTEPRIQYLLTRNVIDVIRDMMGNPAFRDLLVYAPERHKCVAEDEVKGGSGHAGAVDYCDGPN